jgi:putative proteasome-type protease
LSAALSTIPITFCLGINLEEGLVGIADTRITSGSECITAKKVKVYQGPKSSFFIMTSGLRSVRDKSLTYFDEAMDKRGRTFDRLFKALNCYAAQVRRVAEEDGKALEEAGLHFNIHVLMGGQLAGDKEHKLYLLYPQGNWVEIGEGTPYQIIGAAAYGKPVLDRKSRSASRRLLMPQRLHRRDTRCRMRRKPSCREHDEAEHDRGATEHERIVAR